MRPLRHHQAAGAHRGRQRGRPAQQQQQHLRRAASCAHRRAACWEAPPAWPRLETAPNRMPGEARMRCLVLQRLQPLRLPRLGCRHCPAGPNGTFFGCCCRRRLAWRHPAAALPALVAAGRAAAAAAPCLGGGAAGAAGRAAAGGPCAAEAGRLAAWAALAAAAQAQTVTGASVPCREQPGSGSNAQPRLSQAVWGA